MNTSDRLLDLTTIRQLLMQRIIAGENARINKEYDAIAADLEKQLRGPELTEYKGKRLAQAIEELKARVSVAEPAVGDLAATEADYTVQSMAQVGINAVLPPEDVINRVAKNSLIQGATIGQWWSKLNDTTKFDLERIIRNGVLLGQTNREIAKAIVGVGTDKGPEALSKARRDAMAITRTAVQTISNEARLATYDSNADIIKAIQWVSTLDGRTSDICIARSGKTWSFPDYEPIGHSIPWGGGPPAHWSCRSTTIPVTKTFDELDGTSGVNPDASISTRSSMDGQVAADLSFDQFLKSKPDSFADEMLGKGKAQLWRDGKITLSELLSAKGTPLTLAQLKERYGASISSATIETNPFDLTLDAGKWHNAAFKNASRDKARKVAATIQDIDVKTNVSAGTAHANSGKNVSISAASYPIDSRKGQDVWRHEFGHILDYRSGFKRIQLEASNPEIGLKLGKKMSFYRSDADDFVSARKIDAKKLVSNSPNASMEMRQSLKRSYDEIGNAAQNYNADQIRVMASNANINVSKLEDAMRDTTLFFENGGYDVADTRARLAKALVAYEKRDIETFINEMAWHQTGLANKKLISQKSEVWSYFSDAAGSMTNNKVAGLYKSVGGHTDAYLKQHGLNNELYANLYAIYSQPNPVFWEIMKHFMPEVSSVFEKDIDIWLSINKK